MPAELRIAWPVPEEETEPAAPLEADEPFNALSSELRLPPDVTLVVMANLVGLNLVAYPGGEPRVAGKDLTDASKGFAGGSCR
jgi:hypothetical protein